MKFGSRTKLICILLSGTALLSTAAVAETTLRALDGSFEMKGETVTFDEEQFFLQTSQGELIVQREFVTCEGDGCPPEELAEEAGDKVNLISLDGSFELNGTLLQVTPTDFVIQTGDGSVTVQREFVTCEGAACPSVEVDKTSFSIAVSNDAGADLLSTVVGDFASSKDYGVTQSVGGGDVLSTILVGDEQGAEVANITVTKMDGTAAIQALLNGDVSMALTQEEVTASQLSEITGQPVADVGTLLNETTIGLDAITFVTNPQNRINVLSIDNVRAVMTGEITNWSELGGADAPISVHMLAADASVTQQLSARMLGDAGPSADHVSHETSAALNEAVASDSNAIGVVYRSQVDGTKPLDLVSSCNIFFGSSDFSVQTEEYPLTVRWNQYTIASDNIPAFAGDIGDFVVTDFGQQSVASKGLIAQELRVLPIKDQGDRILTSVLANGNSAAAADITRQYFAQTSNAERLSTSLRFLTGVAELDAKAVDDVRRISTVIRSDQYEGYEVLVFGFTDSVGSIRSNLSLAERRAQAVKEILISENVGFLDDETVSTFGMGPIAPVNCNDEAAGRELNRRVEVWIRPKA